MTSQRHLMINTIIKSSIGRRTVALLRISFFLLSNIFYPAIGALNCNHVLAASSTLNLWIFIITPSYLIYCSTSSIATPHYHRIHCSTSLSSHSLQFNLIHLFFLEHSHCIDLVFASQLITSSLSPLFSITSVHCSFSHHIFIDLSLAHHHNFFIINHWINYSMHVKSIDLSYLCHCS